MLRIQKEKILKYGTGLTESRSVEAASARVPLLFSSSCGENCSYARVTGVFSPRMTHANDTKQDVMQGDHGAGGHANACTLTTMAPGCRSSALRTPADSTRRSAREPSPGSASLDPQAWQNATARWMPSPQGNCGDSSPAPTLQGLVTCDLCDVHRLSGQQALPFAP